MELIDFFVLGGGGFNQKEKQFISLSLFNTINKNANVL